MEVQVYKYSVRCNKVQILRISIRAKFARWELFITIWVMLLIIGSDFCCHLLSSALEYKLLQRSKREMIWRRNQLRELKDSRLLNWKWNQWGRLLQMSCSSGRSDLEKVLEGLLDKVGHMSRSWCKSKSDHYKCPLRLLLHRVPERRRGADWSLLWFEKSLCPSYFKGKGLICLFISWAFWEVEVGKDSW